MNYKHDAIEFKLKKQKTLELLRKLDIEIVVETALTQR